MGEGIPRGDDGAVRVAVVTQFESVLLRLRTQES